MALFVDILIIILYALMIPFVSVVLYLLLRLRLKEKRQRWHNMCHVVECHEMHTQSIFFKRDQKSLWGK